MLCPGGKRVEKQERKKNLVPDREVTGGKEGTKNSHGNRFSSAEGKKKEGRSA